MEQLKALATFHEVEIALIGSSQNKGYFHVLWKGDTDRVTPLRFFTSGRASARLDAEWRGVRRRGCEYIVF